MSLFPTARIRKLSEIAYGEAMRRLNDPHKAADASQDAMLAYCTLKIAGKRFDRTTAFVRRLGRCKAIDLFRRNMKYRPLDDASVDPRPSPRDEAIGKLLVEALLSELQTLPEFERRVYELIALQQLSPREVAILTDRTPLAISSVYFRAKRRLGHLGSSARGMRGPS